MQRANLKKRYIINTNKHWLVLLLCSLACIYPQILAAEETRLKVGVYNNAPTIFMGSDNKPQGLFIDILEDIARREKWQLEYQYGHFNDLLNQIKDEELDLLPAIAFAKKRKAFVNYTFETVMANWAELYVSEDAQLTSILDLQGAKVGVKSGDIHFTVLKQMTERFNIECRFLETDEYGTVFEMLQAGQVDVGVVNRLFGKRHKLDYSVVATPVIFNPVEMRYGAPLNRNVDIIGKIDGYLGEYKRNNNSIYYKSINRWFVLETENTVPSWLFFTIYLAAGISLLFFASSLLFRRLIKQKTAELQKTNETLTQQVEERKKTEETLQRHARMVEASSDGMALLTKDHKHILTNPAYCQIVTKADTISADVPLPELLGNDFFELELKTAIDQCLQGSVVTVQTRPRKEHSNPNYWNLTLSPYYSENSTADRYMVDIRDVTEQVELQNRLKNSQKMEAIGMLAGGVAHDLNNILSGIVSYPDMLLVGLPADNPMTKPLATIKKSGERAAAIVQDLLTLARRGIGTVTPLNLNTIIEDFLASPEHDEIVRSVQKIKYHIDLQNELPNIKGSAPHLSTLFMNLFTNAIEAMPKGGTLTISTQFIALKEPQNSYEFIPPGQYIQLSITDTGVGIDHSEINRIFEPFYSSKVMGRSGTGLGMAVVWGVIKDHQGFIDVQSQPGRGTIFRGLFPITDQSLPKKDAVTLENYLGNGEKILVVDDLEEQRILATSILDKLGYIPDIAESGEEAVEKCRTSNYDLLILDMILDGGMDGLSTYQEILKIKEDQKAIIASGFSESARVKQAQNIGAGQYIKKPYSVESLAKTIQHELQRN